jgi:hypothetical protein
MSQGIILANHVSLCFPGKIMANKLHKNAVEDYLMSKNCFGFARNWMARSSP